MWTEGLVDKIIINMWWMAQMDRMESVYVLMEGRRGYININMLWMCRINRMDNVYALDREEARNTEY